MSVAEVGGEGSAPTEAVRKAKIGEISQRADRPDDYEGYAVVLGDLQVSKHGIGGVQFAQVAVDTETGVVKVERVVASTTAAARSTRSSPRARSTAG